VDPVRSGGEGDGDMDTEVSYPVDSDGVGELVADENSRLGSSSSSTGCAVASDELCCCENPACACGFGVGAFVIVDAERECVCTCCETTRVHDGPGPAVRHGSGRLGQRRRRR
jgi:hypothetical protein